jgi:hypothetical protein
MRFFFFLLLLNLKKKLKKEKLNKQMRFSQKRKITGTKELFSCPINPDPNNDAVLLISFILMIRSVAPSV